MGRPVGVTILAILNFLGAACCVLFGLLMMVGGGFLATAMSQAQSTNASSTGSMGFLVGLGAAAGVLFLIIAAIAVLVGWGLWMVKDWARIASIVLTALNGALQVFGLLASFATLHIFNIIWALFWLAVDGLIIWYLLRPDVRAAFKAGQAKAATA